MIIRPIERAEHRDVLAAINAAAKAYKGVIPDDRWHDPYMDSDEFDRELNAGVVFSGCYLDGRLAGVMGAQLRLNVMLIRHAYVLPELQGRGLGAALLAHIRKGTVMPILIGTWVAANWAIRFYQRHGFALVDGGSIAPLLETYWNVPARQVETSVVLSAPPMSSAEVRKLIAEANKLL